MRDLVLMTLLLVTGPRELLTQTSGSLSRAAASITTRDVADRIAVIADDSMLGRDTPSRGLDLTAQYVAKQFQEFGLRPGGDNSSWFQRYPISRRRLDLDSSRVVFVARGKTAGAGFRTSARLLHGDVPEEPIVGPAVLVTGPISAEALGRLQVKNRIVLLPFGRTTWANATPAEKEGPLLLYNLEPRALLLLTELDSAEFASHIPAQAPERTAIGSGREPPALELQLASVAPALRVTGIDLRSAPSNRGAVRARELSGVTARIELRDSIISMLSAPNTVGIVEGTHPRMKHEYIVFSAHMDHIGIRPGRADSINNGADDNASGTAGLIELAQAFSEPGARPLRSIIFLTVSGEEKGLWGSDYFSRHPPVPIQQIVANINVDMIGRNWPDTVVAIGKEHSDLGATLARVNAAHPELGINAIDDPWPEERFYFRSDHYNFARRGVPVLFFFSGVHEDYHEVTDSPDKINSEKEARILKLVFYLGQEVANAPVRPKWKPESYKEIVEE